MLTRSMKFEVSTHASLEVVRKISLKIIKKKK